MFSDISKLYKMRDYAKQLSEGIDPTSGIQFLDDSIMNMDKIKTHNKDVYKLIDSIIIAEIRQTKKGSRKIPFFMFDESKNRFQYFIDPISISKLCNKINEYSMSGMAKLRPMDLTRGLTYMEYLKDISIDGEESCKVPTEKGKMIGISRESRKNQYGNDYSVNLYDTNAQRFIVGHLEEILDYN